MNTCPPSRPAFRGALDALNDLLAVVPVCDRARADVRQRMAAPGRHYHGLLHPAILWAGTSRSAAAPTSTSRA